MKDQKFDENLENIEEMIEKLNSADLTFEEGKRIKEEADNLIEDSERLLEVGSGKVKLVEMKNGKVVEKSLELGKV